MLWLASPYSNKMRHFTLLGPQLHTSCQSVMREVDWKNGSRHNKNSNRHTEIPAFIRDKNMFSTLLRSSKNGIRYSPTLSGLNGWRSTLRFTPLLDVLCHLGYATSDMNRIVCTISFNTVVVVCLRQNTCKEKANFLEKARQRNERNKLDVERYYMKKRHLDRIQMLEKKKPWVVSRNTTIQLTHCSMRALVFYPWFSVQFWWLGTLKFFY